MIASTLRCLILSLVFVSTSAAADEELNPFGEFGVFLGQQATEAFRNLIAARQGVSNESREVDQARADLTACGQCSDAPGLRARLDDLRRKESRGRSYASAVAEDADRQNHTQFAPIFKQITPPPSMELQRTQQASLLVKRFCYAETYAKSKDEGINWDKIDDCRRAIPAQDFAELQLQVRSKCLDNAHEVSGYNDNGAPRASDPPGIQQQGERFMQMAQSCTASSPFHRITSGIMKLCPRTTEYKINYGSDYDFQGSCINQFKLTPASPGPLPTVKAGPPTVFKKPGQ